MKRSTATKCHDGKWEFSSTHQRKGKSIAIVHVGIDLAKNVFAVHGVNEVGKPELVRPSVPHAKLHELIASLPPCTVAMEACSGGHHWERLFTAHGHSVRLIAPKFVVPYRMSGARGKNDAADAAAICAAVQRPAMRFVPVKSIDQQARVMVHRARQGFVETRTATINRLRGLLSELGIVLPLRAATVRREAGAALEALPGWANTVVGDLLSELHRLDERIAQYDRHISAIAREGATAAGMSIAARWFPGITNGEFFMKVMTCRELGGPCDQELSAATWDDMVKNMTKHVMEKHPDTTKAMEKMHNEDPKKWGREKKPKWDAKPDV